MSLVHPWEALLVAAVAVPLLLLLYFLKLRRRRQTVASTLLWRRAFEDLQVNTPFQRLRFSWLLLLQALILLLLLLAVAEPTLSGGGPAPARVVLLVDRSASMSAADAGPDGRTRLDAARDEAIAIVEGLRRGGRATTALVIAFGARAEVVTGFEARRDVLVEAIEAIAPSDEEANLDAALQLAGTFGTGGEERDAAPPEVVLISDGGVAPAADAAGFALAAGRFRFVRVGPDAGAAARNTGIVSLAARRDLDDPARVVVFARLLNAGPEAVETIVTLAVDGADVVTRPLPIDGAAEDGPPGEAAASFTVTLDGGALLTLRHAERDALPTDDTAAVLLPAPSRPRIALVYGERGPDARLRRLLEEYPPRALRSMSAATYEADPDSIADEFDVVVFDGVAPGALPRIPSLTFGAAPPGIGTRPASAPGGARILSWRRQNPILRHVALDTIVYADFGGLELPPSAVALATGPDGPVIAQLRAHAAPHIVVGFRLDRSNWPTNVSIAVFLQNALDVMTGSRSGRASLVVRPGESVPVRVRSDADAVVVRGRGAAGGAARSIDAAPGALIALPAFERVGVYDVAGVEPPWDTVAVSLLSEVESDTRPRESIVVNAEPVLANRSGETVPRGIWPWLVAAAAALAAMEWILYCRRAQG